MSHVPGAWPSILLALGVFRLVRLIGWDDITTRLRARVTGISDHDYGTAAEIVDAAEAKGLDPWDVTGLPISRRRFYAARLLRCPWCVGFWLSGAVWVAWLAAPTATLVAAVPFALSASVGLVAKNLDP